MASTKTTVKLILGGEWSKASNDVQTSHNVTLNRLYEWSQYRENLDNIPFEKVTSFIQKNSDWPDQDKLLATAERNMPDTLAAPDVMAWFTAHPPVTGIGITKYLKAASSLNQQPAIRDKIDAAWPTASMDKDIQSAILQNYGRWISPSAQNKRLDYLLNDESYTLAKSLAAQLKNGYPQLVDARIALTEEKKNAPALVASVPSHLQNNTGLLFERLRWNRRNNNDATAIAILDSVNASADITFPKEWWKERSVMIRRMIETHNYKKAYQLAAQHKIISGPEHAEAEWMSGWLALRFLNQPSLAMGHFTRMYGAVETAISRARGAYWIGRTEEALLKPKEAKTWFQIAATYPHTYYGQVAITHLHIVPKPSATVAATEVDTKNIASSELVQVASLVRQAGFHDLSVRFVNAKLESLKTPGEYKAFATYLTLNSDISGAYRVAKRASWKNYFLGKSAYPTLMPVIQNLSIDPALVHGIIRQESQFDPEAKSPAGALGLMQLMPGTAREIAKKRGWGYQTSWLTARPDHNILLGSAYLNDLLKRFNGSYPLAIAAYNAGPSRVNEWLKTFGDPRLGKVDWIDWIELIPVAETRNYVQRVTEGTVTYRDHLGLIKK